MLGPPMATFILRLDDPGDAGLGGPRLAVKDLLDVVGTPTTAGSAVVAANAEPAPTDAPCVAAARAAGARIVGKTNLHELAFGGTGINPHFGTPVNPLDPTRIPGGRRAAPPSQSPPGRPTSPSAPTPPGRFGPRRPAAAP